MGWNDELAAALAQGLQRQGASADLHDIWAGWASEIAADAFSFAHTGFASVAALHDVLDGDPAQVVSPPAGRPSSDQLPARPAGRADVPPFLRRGAVGHARAVVDRHAPAGSAPRRDARDRAGLRLRCSTRWCGSRSTRRCARSRRRALRAIVMPERVSPAALTELAARIGHALFTSAHWLWTEPLRIVGLTGLQLASRSRLNPSRSWSCSANRCCGLGGALQTA